MTITITAIPAHVMRARMYEALSVYVQAMGYPTGVEHMRAPMWSEHILRSGWRAVGAFDCPPDTRISPDTPLLGIGYGYRGAPSYWWDTQVREGLAQTGGSRRILDSYFELTELHVRPDQQGRGIGNLVLQELLEGRPEERVLLSTPEVPRESNRAWGLYRRLGFQDVLRNFIFHGDNRPFAILGRDLPLPAQPSGPEPAARII